MDSPIAPQANLQRLQRELHTLLNSAGMGIVFIRQRLVQRCNPRFAEIFGYDQSADLQGLNSVYLHPNRQAFKALGRKAYPTLSQGGTYRTECQLRRGNGQLFWPISAAS